MAPVFVAKRQIGSVREKELGYLNCELLVERGQPHERSVSFVNHASAFRFVGRHNASAAAHV